MEGPSGLCTGLMTIQFDAGDLAQALFQVYLYMFLDEENVLKIANISLEGLLKSSQVWYHRASFASFLRLVKTQVTCNWDAAMDALIVLIENRRHAPMGMMYILELFIYLYMLDVFSFKVLKEWHNRNQMDVGFSSLFAPIVSRVTTVNAEWGDLRDWKNIPLVVCVTFKVPRKQLSVFTNMNRSKLGTPHVHCLLQGACSPGMNTWQNLFPACQLEFGDVSTSGNPHNDSFEISVAEKDLGWKGTSALIVAFYVPAFFLLLEPQKATVVFGIHSSPATTMNFASKLGITMNVYETALENSTNVYITRYSPNQTGFPVSPGFAQTELVGRNGIMWQLRTGFSLKGLKLAVTSAWTGMEIPSKRSWLRDTSDERTTTFDASLVPNQETQSIMIGIKRSNQLTHQRASVVDRQIWLRCIGVFIGGGIFTYVKWACNE